MPWHTKFGLSIAWDYARRSPVRAFRRMFSLKGWETLARATKLRGAQDQDEYHWTREEAERYDAMHPWSEQGGLKKRAYDNYEDYVRHQTEKFHKTANYREITKDEHYTKFRQRFEQCAELNDKHTVLCLGARVGMEVKALIDMGHFAVGIDLEPGLHNEYVLQGDFHRLIFSEVSVHAVYTNCLDHVFDLDKILSEVRRVLQPDGVFLIDFMIGEEEGYSADAFESFHWSSTSDLIQAIERRAFKLMVERAVPDTKRWRQAVFCPQGYTDVNQVPGFNRKELTIECASKR